MATGGSDSKVHVYFSPENGSSSRFQLCYTLDGHDNWIRGLSLAYTKQSSILLSSASQDKYIRIWKIAFCDELCPPKAEVTSPTLKAFRWSTADLGFHIETTLVSVLLGHDDWVYSCRWVGSYIEDHNSNTWLLQVPLLLSASSDGSMILWQPYEKTWISMVRITFYLKATIGDLSDTFGYYGASASADLLNIVGHSHSGSLQLWKREDASTAWQCFAMPTGHTGPISGLSLYPDGANSFLASVSYAAVK